MTDAIKKMNALFSLSKTTASNALSLRLYKAVNIDGDELSAFRLFVLEIFREISVTSPEKVEPSAHRDLTKLVYKLLEFTCLFNDESMADRDIWADVSNRERRVFYLCATELFKFLFVSRSGGVWRGVDAEMSDPISPANRELEAMQETYLYFAQEAETVELGDIEG